MWNPIRTQLNKDLEAFNKRIDAKVQERFDNLETNGKINWQLAINNSNFKEMLPKWLNEALEEWPLDVEADFIREIANSQKGDIIKNRKITLKEIEAVRLFMEYFPKWIGKLTNV